MGNRRIRKDLFFNSENKYANPELYYLYVARNALLQHLWFMVIFITNIIWIVALSFDVYAFNKKSFNPQTPRVFLPVVVHCERLSSELVKTFHKVCLYTHNHYSQK
jgi:hypothetical protein